MTNLDPGGRKRRWSILKKSKMSAEDRIVLTFSRPDDPSLRGASIRDIIFPQVNQGLRF